MLPEKVPTYFKGEKFLRGPIPLVWLARASKCGGRSLALGILIWHKCRIQKNDRIVTVGSREKRMFGLDRYAYYRALKNLEKEGLVFLERRRGAGTLIKILYERAIEAENGDN